MGAASADIPAILVTGGPQLKGNWKGEELGSCTDCRRYEVELRAGTIDENDWAELQSCIVRSNGHCMTMGTASTMGTMGEALGMALPGNAAIPAVDSRRKQLAEEAGRQIVKNVGSDLIPSKIMDEKAFDNAIKCLHAIGGSTNAIIHLIAIAGRVGIDLSLERFDELSKTTPFLLNLKPSGQYLMEDFYYAGGVPALMGRIESLLDRDNITVTGNTLGENISGHMVHNDDIIRSMSDPLDPEGGLAVLYGNIAPTGAIIKPTAASPDLMVHKGKAIVFEDHDDLGRRIDDPNLSVSPDDILVMKNSGPIGGPGIPEWGFLPIPKKILATGVRDMVRLSDARMSGTAFGTVVVHVTPESAGGGPLSAIRDGDMVEIDVPNRKLNLLVSDEELAARLGSDSKDVREFKRGYKWLHAQHILQADQGCDFDFLRSEILQ